MMYTLIFYNLVIHISTHQVKEHEAVCKYMGPEDDISSFPDQSSEHYSV